MPAGSGLTLQLPEVVPGAPDTRDSLHYNDFDARVTTATEPERTARGHEEDSRRTPIVRPEGASLVDRERFQDYVQETLAHLYDYSYLQTHPLAALVAEGPLEEARGRTLYRLLVAAIDQLKPPSTAPASSPAWRKYGCLLRRYVEGITLERVAEESGVTTRQARRDHHEAIEAVTSILWNRYVSSQPAPPRRAPVPPDCEPHDADSELEAELLRVAADAPRGPTALLDVATGALATISRLAESRGVKLSLIAPNDLPSVAVDRTALRQVLLSLLNYTIEQVAASHVTLEVNPDYHQVSLQIRVARPTHAPLRSEERAPGDRSRINTSEQLLSMQGGRLVFCEDGADGLVVTLEMPVARSVSVLVVDDNPDVALLFQRYLGSSYRVVQAHSAAEIFTLIEEARPDVISLDVLMPTEDGWEILQQLQDNAATRDIPVIVCSVLREGSLALSLGATEFLPKPVSREGLRTALERCCRRSPQAGRQGWPEGSGRTPPPTASSRG